MKKILIIDTTYPINSRTEKFKRTLQKKYKIFVSAWSRGKDYKKEEDYYVMKSEIGYGRKFLKLLTLPFFILHNIVVFRKIKPDMVFASHWDSLICASILKILNRKTIVVYDCLDLPTSSNSVFLKLIKYIERFSLRLTNTTIFASRYFSELYDNNKNSLVFENYPTKDILIKKEIPDWFKNYEYLELNNIKSVSWIGVVRYFEIIENILLAIENTDIYLFVFGSGPDLEKVKISVKEKKMEGRVIFFGRYKHNDLNFIYSISQLVWAAYPTNDFNARYAISNKYFECSLLCKKIILSKRTKMAENLNGFNSVVAVNEYSVQDIKNVLDSELSIKKFIDYEKYENDTIWESQENRFLEHIENVILSNKN